MTARLRRVLWVLMPLALGACSFSSEGIVGELAAADGPMTQVPAATTSAATTSAAMPTKGVTTFGAPAGLGRPKSPLADPQPSIPAVPAVPPDVATAADANKNGCSEPRVSSSTPCSADPDPCGLRSGWPGDEYCLPPPAPEEGVQIHIGPKDYANPAELMKYVMVPGEETNNSVLAHIPVDRERWWYRMRVQMRPGSHHWIGSQVQGKPAEGSYENVDCNGAPRIASLGGGQNLIYDDPPGGIAAPENIGMGWNVQPNASMCMNLHAYNFDDEPHLKEIWVNLYYVDVSDVTQRGTSIALVGGLGLKLQPGRSLEQTYQSMFWQDGRIVQLFGHRHMWTPRFAVWLNSELIYDSWNWNEAVTFNYDSVTNNPRVDTAAKTDGAVSGPVVVKAGDILTFTCFIENQSDVVLTFKNEIRNGEMCNLWGRTIGGGLSGFFQ